MLHAYRPILGTNWCEGLEGVAQVKSGAQFVLGETENGPVLVDNHEDEVTPLDVARPNEDNLPTIHVCGDQMLVVNSLGAEKITQGADVVPPIVDEMPLQLEDLCEVPILQVEDDFDFNHFDGVAGLGAKKRRGRPKGQSKGRRGRKRVVNVTANSLHLAQSDDDNNPILVAQKICAFGKELGVKYCDNEKEIVDKLVEMELRDVSV
ncbi:FAD-dependent oxidoreductase [Sesbania bispinosa]|nr:FAD-dependent oxidoreductase [Sesbania bispinosa]